MKREATEEALLDSVQTEASDYVYVPNPRLAMALADSDKSWRALRRQTRKLRKANDALEAGLLR